RSGKVNPGRAYPMDAFRYGGRFAVMQFPEIRGMMEPMRSMMEEFFSAPLINSPFFNWPGAMPAIDIEETDDAYIVTAEVPGFNKDEIEVELRNNVLMIRGKRE